ncbi:PHB depolymerase family esterase [soil metagenome]
MQGLGETTAMLARLRRSMPGASDAAPAGSGLIETTSFGDNPGALRMLSYAPARLVKGAPLVVVLHGCTQNGQAYARDAGWIAVADRLGFAVLAPEQRPANNPNRCFNWFEPGDIHRGQGEAASIASMVAAALALHRCDPGRVFVTGLSAGGAMSAVLLAAYPDLFAGGAIIAGLAYGVARGVPEALQAMRQGRSRPVAALAGLVEPRQAPLKLSIWHGDADHVVNVANGADLATQWTAAAGLAVTPPKVERLAGRTKTVWEGGIDGAVVEFNIVHGLGHGVALATGGQDGLGHAAPYMLETGISSTLEIARFWGLDTLAVDEAAASSQVTSQGAQGAGRTSIAPGDADVPPTPVQSPGLAARVLETVSGHVSPDVREVISKALRAAGLLT